MNSTKIWTSIALACLASCRSAAPSENVGASEVRTMRLSVLGGARELDDSSWRPSERPTSVGVEFDNRGEDGALGFEAGVSLAFDTQQSGATDQTVQIANYFAGLRKTFDVFGGRVHPYFAAGPELVHGSIEQSQGGVAQAQRADTSWGIYARVGLYVDLSSRWSFGADYHRLFLADADLGGMSSSFDSQQFMLTLGYAF